MVSDYQSARQRETTLKLREAVIALLQEEGYPATTIEAVAARSGVAKTTIYRRWRTKVAMVFDLALHEDSRPIDEGGLEADLAVLVRRVTLLMTSPLGRTVLPGLLGDMSKDEVLRDRIRHTLVSDGEREVSGVLDRARARGEDCGTVSARQIQFALLGTAFAWAQLDEIAPRDLEARLTDLVRALVSR